MEPTEVVSSVASDFKQAFTLLRRALRSSVRATYVGTYGSQHALRKPLLYTQGINIFGAGHVKLGKKRVTVWIDKKDFEYWFKSTLVPRKNVSPEAKLIFHKVVTAFLVENAHQFSERQIRGIFIHWLGHDLTPTAVGDIKSLIPETARRGGRPKSASRWRPNRDKLLDALRKQALAPPDQRQ